MTESLENLYGYYSVTRPVRINDQKRVPCVCYPRGSLGLEKMQEFEAKGLIKLYDHPVRFVNGAVREEIAPVVPTIIDTPQEVPAPTEFADHE